MTGSLISYVFYVFFPPQFKNDLLSRIQKIEPAGGIKYLNILLLGQAASGKSAFFNTCCTALMNDNRMITANQVYLHTNTSVSTTVRFILFIKTLKKDYGKHTRLIVSLAHLFFRVRERFDIHHFKNDVI
jgi:septin family protein